MAGRVQLTGVFDDPHGVLHALEALKMRGIADPTVYSPIPEPEFVEATGGERSAVRRWALVGGILGCVSGFALTLWTTFAYPLVVGGKPLSSIPAYVVIAFELTILFTGIAALIGLLIHNRMPRLRLRADFDPRFTGDRFGVVVSVPAADGAAIERALREAGAEEVRRG